MAIQTYSTGQAAAVVGIDPRVLHIWAARDYVSYTLIERGRRTYRKFTTDDIQRLAIVLELRKLDIGPATGSKLVDWIREAGAQRHGFVDTASRDFDLRKAGKAPGRFLLLQRVGEGYRGLLAAPDVALGKAIGAPMVLCLDVEAMLTAESNVLTALHRLGLLTIKQRK